MTDFGYAGKIMQVNLSNEQITEISIFDYADRFLGGRGIVALAFICH
ncbi:MAG: hypothetical protein HQ553_09380 [Chloroflexi bacterium]|nr:hypothetical protein [Chloroflexota bacterium]